MEPQRINLTSDLSILLRTYPTSPKNEAEIKEQVQNFLKAGIINPLMPELYFLNRF